MKDETMRVLSALLFFGAEAFLVAAIFFAIALAQSTSEPEVAFLVSACILGLLVSRSMVTHKNNK